MEPAYFSEKFRFHLPDYTEPQPRRPQTIFIQPITQEIRNTVITPIQTLDLTLRSVALHVADPDTDRNHCTRFATIWRLGVGTPAWAWDVLSSIPIQTDFGAHPTVHWVPEHLLGGKAVGAWRSPPTPPPNAEVKERVELYLYSTSAPSWHVIDRHLAFYHDTSYLEVVVRFLISFRQCRASRLP